MRVSFRHRLKMKIICAVFGSLPLLLANGCGLEYIATDRDTGLPSDLVVTGWTNDGCIENLYTAAEELSLKINLVEVIREYEGFGAIPMPSPFFPMYTCKGQILPLEGL